MLELPNFDHMTTSTISFESRHKILLVTLLSRIMMSQPLFQNIFILRSSWVANFADIIKIVTMFIKKSLKTQKNLKELEIMYQNAIFICILWYNKIC